MSTKEETYEDAFDVRGEVRQADLDGCRFALLLPSGFKLDGKFSPEQEDLVVNALRSHGTRDLRVVGRGRFTKEGKLDRIMSIEELELVPKNQCVSTRPLWEVIVELGASIPEEELAKLPRDLSLNLDRYLDDEQVS